MQWPNGVRPANSCPACNTAGYRITPSGQRPIYRCFQCGRQFGAGIPNPPKENK